jgi:UDPglucose 6-dehydrogenase
MHTQNLQKSDLVIGIIGNGYVGGAAAYSFSQIAEVLINDIEKTRSTSSISEIVLKSNIIFVCVPTPTDEDGIVLTEVDSVMETIHKYRDAYKEHPADQIVVIKSTVVPGTCIDYISKYGFHIVSNPEFLTQRTAKLDFINPDRIVIGSMNTPVSETLTEAYKLLLQDPPIIYVHPTEAEMIKYVSNCFFATKISFMNEMNQIVENLGIRWESVVKGVSASGRIANSHLQVPGPDGKYGYGGACFPKDVDAMIRLAEKFNVKPLVLTSVQDKNKEVREID